MSQNDNHQKRLEILYDEQRSLLERVQIHQRNLNYLLSQKAKHGLDAPLRLFNETNQQEEELNAIKKQLSNIDLEINGLLSAARSSSIAPNSSSTLPRVNIGGEDYIIEVPFPFLRIETTLPVAGQMCSKWYYAGGFEVHVLIEAGKELQFSFYAHNKQVAPILDAQNKKIVMPTGIAIIIPGLRLNTRTIISEQDLTPEVVSEGRWTVISPNHPLDSITTNDWPQGRSDFITTTKVIYEGGYELWFVQFVNEPEVTVWFYEQGWNVAPSINKPILALSFPKVSHTEG